MAERLFKIDAAKQMVAAAAAAPSLHNSQPWRFRLSGDTIELYADPTRTPRVADPTGRETQVACGAALFNLRLAVATHGREPEVSLLPERRDPDLLAKVRIARTRRVSMEDRALHFAIPWRHANRGPFENRSIPEWLRLELEDAARVEGAELILPRVTETERILDLVAEAEERLTSDPAYREELEQWTTPDPTRRDGIPDTNFGPTSAGRAVPLRDFAPGASPRDRRAVTYESPVRLAVLATEADAPADRLRSGQALQRVLLAATLHDLSAGFMTQPLEDAELRKAVHGPGRRSGRPQMVMRLGYARRAVRATPRRDVSEVLEVAEA